MTGRQAGRQAGRDKKRQRERQGGRQMHNLVPRLLLSFSVTHYTTKKPEEPENNVNHVDTNHVLHCAH